MARVGRPTLTVCIVTQDRAPLLRGLLANVRDVADEIVVVDGGSRDDTAAVAAAEPKVRLHHRPFDLARNQKNHAFGLARGDWILVVDTDERLGERLRARLPRLLAHPRNRWYKFPRYWVGAVDPLRYVRAKRLYPDWQLRLFRNEEFWRYAGDRSIHHHFPREGRGVGRRVRGAHVFHFDFLLATRAEREAKVARYLRLAPESEPVNSMYLYEDIPHTLSRCRERVSDVPAPP